MGIRKLNQFIRANCTDQISKISLWELRGKKIVIDTSIYMYRFAGEGDVVTGMYQMISTFLYYGIIPLFVFDGEAPAAKRELLEHRKMEKKEAEDEYNARQANLDATEECEDYAERAAELDVLRKKFIRLRSEDIDNVKKLMKLMGVTYYEAEGEADELCAKLVIKKRVWACLSEDMDMFVYGCCRVLRYLSLLNSSVVLYDMKGILSRLDLSLTEFKEICVLSGTDYNFTQNKSIDLHRALKLFAKYRRSREDCGFYEWLENNTNCVDDFCRLHATFIMFNLQNVSLASFDKQRIVNGPSNDILVRKFLEDFDFMFID